MSYIPPYRTTTPTAYTPTYQEAYPVEYFSGVDVSIFFAGLYIDEITDFTYELRENQTPIYGYASYSPNTFVTSSRIIAGEFTINMRGLDYLHELVNAVSSNNTAVLKNAGQLIGSGLNSVLTGLQNPVGALLSSGNASYLNESEQAAINATQALSTVSTGTAGGPINNLVSQNLYPSSLQLPGAPAGLTAPDPSIDPTGYSQWVTQQKDYIWAQQAGLLTPPPDLSQSPYFTNQGFQILLVYGDLDSTDLTSNNAGRIRTIENVYLRTVGTYHDLSGENIKERFMFVAGDINASNRITAANNSIINT